MKVTRAHGGSLVGPKGGIYHLGPTGGRVSGPAPSGAAPRKESVSSLSKQVKEHEAALRTHMRTPGSDHEKGKEMLRKLNDLQDKLSDERKNQATRRAPKVALPSTPKPDPAVIQHLHSGLDPKFTKTELPLLERHGLAAVAKQVQNLGPNAAFDVKLALANRVAAVHPDYKDTPSGGHYFLSDHGRDIERAIRNVQTQPEAHRGAVVSGDPEHRAAVKAALDKVNIPLGGLRIDVGASAGGLSGNASGVYSAGFSKEGMGTASIAVRPTAGASGFSVLGRGKDVEETTRLAVLHELGHHAHASVIKAAIPTSGPPGFDRTLATHDAWTNSKDHGLHDPKLVAANPGVAVLDRLASEHYRPAVQATLQHYTGLGNEAADKADAQARTGKHFPSLYARTSFSEYVAEHVALFHESPAEHADRFPAEHRLIGELHNELRKK